LNGTRPFKVNLKKIMQQRGLKVNQLASLVNAHLSNASLWVNGHEMPPDDIQAIIALWLGKTRDEIWEFKKECFPEIVEISTLNKKLTAVEKTLAEKLGESLKEDV